MKIAITGKGGVGKSTLTAALVLLHAEEGKKILAIDADPMPIWPEHWDCPGSCRNLSYPFPGRRN